MKLNEALRILTDVHTRDDFEIGFVVMMGAKPHFECSMSDYIAAWRVVRDQLKRDGFTEMSDKAFKEAQLIDAARADEQLRMDLADQGIKDRVALATARAEIRGLSMALTDARKEIERLRTALVDVRAEIIRLIETEGKLT